jgi:hypothetical protein
MQQMKITAGGPSAPTRERERLSKTPYRCQCSIRPVRPSLLSLEKRMQKYASDGDLKPGDSLQATPIRRHVPCQCVKHYGKPKERSNSEESAYVNFQRPLRFLPAPVPHQAHGHCADQEEQLHAEIANYSKLPQPSRRPINDRHMERYHHQYRDPAT